MWSWLVNSNPIVGAVLMAYNLWKTAKSGQFVAEQEVQAPKPDTAVMKSSTQALDDVTHSPDVTNAIARVVRFFNSIGIQ